MPITEDYSVFLEGCVKNNAVDYKKLYEEQLLKNEELEEKITCLESDSHNEVSSAEYEDMKEALTQEVNDRVHPEDVAYLFGKANDTDFDWEDEINGVIMENEELKKKVEKNRLEAVKSKNDLEIANMLYIDDIITKQIDDSISSWDSVQFTINCGSDFYKEHKLNYIKEYIIPRLTTSKTGGVYIDGYYYYNGDCMSPFEVEYDKNGTICFNRVETESEEEEE